MKPDRTIRERLKRLRERRENLAVAIDAMEVRTGTWSSLAQNIIRIERDKIVFCLWYSIGMQFKYFDAHSHTQDPQFDFDRDQVFARMKEKSVGALVVGTDWKTSEEAVRLAEQHDFLWATIGQHPTDNHDEIFDSEKYLAFARHPKVVAIGECGLDYYKISNGEFLISKKRQKELFEKHIALALEVKKQLMIHCRDAYDDVLEMLPEGIQANIHFFTGTCGIAQKFLERGCTLSFSGVITFARDYDEVIRLTPIDRILTETDCPYVAPAPYRGKRNEPVYVEEIVKRIALIKNLNVEKVRLATADNAMRWLVA